MTGNLLATLSVIWLFVLGFIDAKLGWVGIMAAVFTGISISRPKLWILIRISLHNKEFDRLIPAAIILLVTATAFSTFCFFIGRVLGSIFK